MKATIRCFLFAAGISLILSGCENDIPVPHDQYAVSMAEYLSDHEDKEVGSELFAFTYGDSASLRHGRLPEHIRGFLPQLREGEELIEVSVFEADAVTHLLEPENDSVFQFTGLAEVESGMFSLAMEQFETDTYLKCAVITSDYVYFSEPALAELVTKQTDFVSPERIDTVRDQLERPVFNMEELYTGKAVFEIYNRSDKHRLSLLTTEPQVAFFSQFDFSRSSRPDLDNPGVTDGTYNITVFFINEKNRARYRTRFYEFVVR